MKTTFKIAVIALIAIAMNAACVSDALAKKGKSGNRSRSSASSRSHSSRNKSSYKKNNHKKSNYKKNSYKKNTHKQGYSKKRQNNKLQNKKYDNKKANYKNLNKKNKYQAKNNKKKKNDFKKDKDFKKNKNFKKDKNDKKFKHHNHKNKFHFHTKWHGKKYHFKHWNRSLWYRHRPVTCHWWYDACPTIQVVAPAEIVTAEVDYVTAQETKWYLGISGMVLPGKGLGLEAVEADSPAAEAGLAAGMLITAVNGMPITDAGTLADAIAASTDGLLELEVLVEGYDEAVPATVQMIEMPVAAL